MVYADTEESEKQLSAYYCLHSKYENDALVRKEFYEIDLREFYNIISEYLGGNMNILDMECGSGEKLQCFL